MNRNIAAWAAFVVAMSFSGAARGQDFYDPTVLRTVNLQFHQANWLALLRANYVSQTDILADMTVDGVVYPSVGVRIRGNTSYTALPANSEKFSLNIDVEAVNAGQELPGGYSSLNFNNGFHDPTFCREVVYNNFVARFIPNPRANHIVLTLNGQNWGVYINVQQFNKQMLSSHFPDTNGLRIKCANNPNGPGLRYNGANPSGYTGYEIKDDGGLADPWGALIAVCNSVTNQNLAQWQVIDTLFAIDPSTWSVVLENILTDDDSYVNKGADFMTYRNPTDGRMFLLQTDANETFTQTTWAINRNFNQAQKPVLSRVLSVAENRQRYMAHYRTIKQDLNWAYFEPLFTAQRNLIDAAVQADPKKLYSYTMFQQNFTTTVNLGGSPPFGGSLIGVQQFVDQRLAFLNSNAELSATGPVIASVVASDDTPDPSQAVTITATVMSSGTGISKVELFYRPSASAGYSRVLMTSVGGNQYAAPLPVAATPGQRVSYYVAATASNSFQSLSFLPQRTEWAPRTVNYTFGSGGGMRITEFMYSGTSGEFIEFTNMSAAPIDMTGWSMDDDHAIAGAFDLSAFGVVQPGESVVVTEADATAFRTAWSLSPSVKVIGGLGVSSGNNFARNDEINLYDAADLLVDRLTYGDQTYPGTIRTQNFSGQTCVDSIGQDDVTLWERSAVTDEYGSYAASTGEVGMPGSYNAPTCGACVGAGVSASPESRTACPDEPVSFAVVPEGTGPLDYQWQVESPAGSGIYVDVSDGALAGVGTVSGSQLASLSLNDLVPGASATFRGMVSNACGGETSEPATLTVRVSCVVGDMNCDGVVSVGDIGGFVLALTDPVGYAGQYPNCDVNNADLNDDGQVTVGDIGAFVTLLTGG